MKTKSTPHYIQSETVESIVDKYLHLWGYAPAQVQYEIHHNFEMDEKEIQKALEHLYKKHSAVRKGNMTMVAKSDLEKAPVKQNKYDPGDIPEAPAAK